MSDNLLSAYNEAFFDKNGELKCESEWAKYPLRTDFIQDICVPHTKSELRKIEAFVQNLKTSERTPDYKMFLSACRQHVAELAKREVTCTHCGKRFEKTIKRCCWMNTYSTTRASTATCFDRVCDECAKTHSLYQDRVMCKTHYERYKDVHIVDWLAEQDSAYRSGGYLYRAKDEFIPKENTRLCDRK